MTICEVCGCVDCLQLTYPLINWQQQVQVQQLGPFDKSCFGSIERRRGRRDNLMSHQKQTLSLGRLSTSMSPKYKARPSCDSSILPRKLTFSSLPPSLPPGQLRSCSRQPSRLQWVHGLLTEKGGSGTNRRPFPTPIFASLDAIVRRTSRYKSPAESNAPYLAYFYAWCLDDA